MPGTGQKYTYLNCLDFPEPLLDIWLIPIITERPNRIAVNGASLLNDKSNKFSTYRYKKYNNGGK